MVFFAGEVALALHGAVVLAFGLIQYDSNPFPRGKESGANVGNSTPLALPNHLHYVADLGVMMSDRELIYTCKLFAYFPPFLICVFEKQNKKTHLRRFTTLHCSCTAHFADQWAGQLEDLGIQEGQIVRE